MTEDEAKEKWCPINSEAVKMGAPALCLASDCMMWRWKRFMGTDIHPPVVSDKEGYCGLAGKP